MDELVDLEDDIGTWRKLLEGSSDVPILLGTGLGLGEQIPETTRLKGASVKDSINEPWQNSPQASLLVPDPNLVPNDTNSKDDSKVSSKDALEDINLDRLVPLDHFLLVVRLRCQLPQPRDVRQQEYFRV